MPRKTVDIVLRDEDGKDVDSIGVGLPIERPITVSEVIALINAFFLLIRRNHITEDTGNLTLTHEKPAIVDTWEVPF